MVLINFGQVHAQDYVTASFRSILLTVQKLFDRDSSPSEAPSAPVLYGPYHTRLLCHGQCSLNSVDCQTKGRCHLTDNGLLRDCVTGTLNLVCAGIPLLMPQPYPYFSCADIRS